MKLSEKLIHLRSVMNMTQDDLATQLNISRQAIAKWESDGAYPSLDKLVLLSKIFLVSIDQLVKEDIAINKYEVVQENVQNKYFGTDGFRGEANADLTVDHAFKVGKFLGWYFQSPLSGMNSSRKPRIVIGKDTRRSSYMLEYAIASGIASTGGDAYILHVTTSPSVSYIVRNDEFDCGVMITASHNPFQDNGIKIISSKGEKLDDKTASYIEAYLDNDLARVGFPFSEIPLAKKDKIGSIVDYYSGRNRYMGYLISLAAHSYHDLRVGLDCANGSSWSIAKTVFEALGAKVYTLGVDPNGLNVNLDCGSTHLEKLQELVKEKHLDVGYAFDGDADRCLAVDENGNVVDGDKIIYILANRLRRKGALHEDTVVTTIMSNSGLTKSLAKIGMKNVQTTVGDRFVYENMLQNGYTLGGEQSGHIIVRKYATTGDGILTALLLTEEMRSRKSTLGALAAPVVLFPQVLKNVKVSSKEAVMQDLDVLEERDKLMKKIGNNGRILLRKSGTEPCIRVMVEAENETLCRDYIEKMVAVIAKKGYICD